MGRAHFISVRKRLPVRVDFETMLAIAGDDFVSFGKRQRGDTEETD